MASSTSSEENYAENLSNQTEEELWAALFSKVRAECGRGPIFTECNRRLLADGHEETTGWTKKILQTKAIFQPSFFKSSQNLVFQSNIEIEPRKTLLTFHYTLVTGCFGAILIIAYENPHITV